jgi:hypothetical protein
LSWWEAQPRELLEQGDVISTVLQVQPVVPVKYLSRGGTGKGGKAMWEESSQQVVTDSESPRILAVTAGTHGLVLSHGCEIDKLKPAHTVLIAPIASMDTLPADMQDKVIKQEVFRYLPLMDIPSLGDFYANLGKTFSLQLRLIEVGHRVASMTDDARLRLRSQLVGYYTRLKVPV